MNSHSLEIIDIGAIKPPKRQWEIYGRDVLDAWRKCIEADGIVMPLLLDRENRLVWGGAPLQIAKELNHTTVPVVRRDDKLPEQMRTYAINFHVLAKRVGIDERLLADEIRELERLLEDDGLDHLAIGEGELIRLLSLDGEIEENDDEPCVNDDVEPITRSADLWQVGPHRFLCGTALERENFVTLMGNEVAEFGLTDMPYNLSMSAISSRRDRKEFAHAHGEMSPNEFARFQTTFMRHMKEFSDPGSLHAFFMSYHFLLEHLRAGTTVFGRPKAMCTWIKAQGGQGKLFRSQTEHILYFRNGDAPHRNNVELGKHGRNRTTAWHYDGMNTPSVERDELLKIHATPKPVTLLKDAILDVTRRGGIVLDPFGGIGSVALAAHSSERRAFIIEIEPKFVDASIRRMAKAFQLDAIRTSDGKLFSELEAMQTKGGA